MSTDYLEWTSTGPAGHQHADFDSVPKIFARLSSVPRSTSPRRSRTSPTRCAVRPGPPPELMSELAGDLGNFEIDADKISAVLVNLLTNAIKFSPDGGRSIWWPPGADQNGDLGHDRGVGLDPRAFEPPVSAFLHSVRFEPALLGRLWLQYAGWGSA